MISRLTVRLTTSACFAAFVASSFPAQAQAQAQAQDTAPADPGAVDEVVVTARRVRETLSDVPASVTVLSADTIEKSGITRTQDFVKLTPGVSIVAGTSEAGDNQINIRGVNGARDAESSVALVVDGILKTNSAVLNQDQGTITQVEILKGPQGAIYGRNATAGAIVIQTRKPTDTLRGGAKVSYGNGETYTGSAYLSGPITDSVGFVVSGDYRKTDGLFRNDFLDRKVVDNQEAWNLNGRVLAKVGDDTTIDAKAKYGRVSGASINFNAVFQLPGAVAAFGSPAFYGDVNDHKFNYYNNIVPTNKQETIESSVKIDHDLGSMTLSGWAQYSNVKNHFIADGTSADFQIFANPAGPANPAVQQVVDACFASTTQLTGFGLNPPAYIGATPSGSTFGPYSPTTCDGSQYQARAQEDVSAELRLASNGDNRFDWQVGAYFLHLKRRTTVASQGDLGSGALPQAYSDPTSISPTNQLFDDQFKTNVYAAFASGDYEVTDKFDAGVAVRYDIEERKVHNLVPLALDPFTGTAINPGQVGGAIDDQQRTFRQFEPKVTARYKFGPEATVYANWGVGFKSGGFNNQGSASLVDAFFNQTLGSDVRIDDQYRKERTSAFEAGVKGRLGPVDYTLAGYYTQVRDMQFFEFFVGPFALLRVVSNIDKVDIKGIEASANVRLKPGWTAFGSVNVTDSKIKANASRPGTVGNKSPYTPDYTINLGSQIEEPLNDRISGILRADYRITGPTWFHTVQDQENPTLFGVNGRYDRSKRDTFGVLDLRVGVRSDAWSVTGFATNLLQKRYLAEVIPAVEFGGSFVSPGDLRRYGVELGYSF